MKNKVHILKPSTPEDSRLNAVARHVSAWMTNRDVWWGALFLIALLFLFVSRLELSIPTYKPGEIAQVTVRSPRDVQIQDVATTERKKAEARERVLPVYDFEPDLANSAVSRLSEVFSFLRTREVPKKLKRLRSACSGSEQQFECRCGSPVPFSRCSRQLQPGA